MVVLWRGSEHADGIDVSAALHRRILWGAGGVGAEEEIQLRRGLAVVE